MGINKVPTSRVIVGVPFTISLHALPYLKDDHPSAECHRKPAAAARESSDFLSELELCNLFPESLVPEYNLIGWVSRVSTAPDQE
jgi:hypothetical protein